MSSPIVHLIRSRLVRVVVLVICITIGIGIVRSVYTLSQKKGIMAERRQVLADLMAKNRQLQQELREATSPAFIEQAARDKMGLVRVGETVVIMDKSKILNPNNQKNSLELPSWKQWWELFF
ncbi:MAG: septum formation initiator family protein [Candidatus Gottesmanbacteria bacterium]|nr:septum formation initiator family protein [Candidatus Gottesmanbacteria bacterium]